MDRRSSRPRRSKLRGRKARLEARIKAWQEGTKTAATLTHKPGSLKR